MLALGIILILIAAGALSAALWGATDQTSTFDFGFFSVEMNTLGIFLTGAVTVLLLVLGLELIRAGVRRANRRRKEKKELNRLAQKLEARESTPAATADTTTQTRTETRTDSPAASDTADTTDTATHTRASHDDSVSGPDRPRT